MNTMWNPRYSYCIETDRNVCVERTEGECREANGCTQPNCPLSEEFGEPSTTAMGRAIRRLLRV